MQSSAGGVPLQLPDFQGPAWMREEQRQAESPEAFGIMPDNWDAARLFFYECSTQWRRDRAGMTMGLRYDALELVIKHHQCADPDDTFRRVQFLERATIERIKR